MKDEIEETLERLSRAVDKASEPECMQEESASQSDNDSHKVKPAEQGSGVGGQLGKFKSKKYKASGFH